MSVFDFQEIRIDGKVIPEGMTVEDMAKRQWPIAKVQTVCWSDGKHTTSLSHEGGLLAKVLPDRSGVIVILFSDGESEARIYNADGSERFTLPRPAREVNNLQGRFSWLEASEIDPLHNVGIVYYVVDNGDMLYLDVDVSRGLYASSHIIKR